MSAPVEPAEAGGVAALIEHAVPQHALSRSKTPKKPIRPKGKEIGGFASDVGTVPKVEQGDGEKKKKNKKKKMALELGGAAANDSGYDSSLPLSSRERIRKRKKEEKMKRKRRKEVGGGNDDDECTDVEEQVALRKLHGDGGDDDDEERAPLAEEQPTPTHDDDDNDDEEEEAVQKTPALGEEDGPSDQTSAPGEGAEGRGEDALVAAVASPAVLRSLNSSVVTRAASAPVQNAVLDEEDSNSEELSDDSDVGEPPALPFERGDSSDTMESVPASIAILEDMSQAEGSSDGSTRKKKKPKELDPAARLLKKQKKKERKERKERKAKRKEKKEKARSMEGTALGTQVSRLASAGMVPEKDLANVPSASAIAERPATLKRQVTPPLPSSNSEGWMSPRRKSATHAKRTARKAKKKGRSGYDSEPELGSGFSAGFASRARKRSGSATFETEMEVPSMVAPKKEGRGGAFRWLKKGSSLFGDGGSFSDAEGKSPKKRGKKGFQNEFAKPARSASKDHSKEMKKAKKELLKFKGKKREGLDDGSPKLSPQSSPKTTAPAEDAEMETPELDDDDDVAPVPEPTAPAPVPAVAAVKAEPREGQMASRKSSGSNIASVLDDLDKAGPKKKGGMLSRFKNRKVIKAEQRRAATQIQAVWKGYILRKKLDAAGNKQTLAKQAVALRQLVATEASYCSSLSIITDKYLNPLKEFSRNNEEARKSLPLQVVDAIFRNVDQIHSLHAKFLKDLEDSLDNWPFCYQQVPTLLLRLAGSLTIYIPYAEEAPSAEETLRFYKQKPPLVSFLTKAYNERRHAANLPPRAQIPDLGALLATPYKHIGKVWLAAAAFFNATPPDSADYLVLADAVAIMGQLRRYVWHIVEEGISKRKMTILSTKIQSTKYVAKPGKQKPRSIELNRRASLRSHDVKLIRGMAVKKPKRRMLFAGDDEAGGSVSPVKVQIAEAKAEEQELPEEDRPFELYAPQRKLVRNGSLSVDGKKRHVFLFNDVCLILEVVSAHSSKFEAVFNLEGARMHSKSVSIDQNVQSFHIKNTKGGDFVFTEPLSNDNNEPSWMQSFEDLIAFTTDKIFSASLEQIVEREGSAIPSLVHKIVQSLNKNITRPGLFQTPPNPKTVQALRDPSAHRKLNQCSPHDVIGLLVMFLEQLPDQVILFDPKDPIFTASSAPSEEVLLKWVRNAVEGMPTHSKNLLEYLVGFLSKTLGRSSSNGVSSIDLAVIFGPLLISPKHLSLEYCFKMPRVVRLVQMIIERAGELFRTADNDSNPIPANIDEFFNADQFGQWWRDFRQKKAYFISYITTPDAIDRLVKYIVDVPDAEDSDEAKQRTQFASLAYGVLVNDGVVQALFENPDRLDSVFKHFQGQGVSERANKHFCDFVEVMLRGNPEAMAQYLEVNSPMNQKVIGSIGSGNFCNMVLSISETWQMNDNIHRIVTGWGALALHQFLQATEAYDSDVLPNTVRFLRFLVRSNVFMTHPLSDNFAKLLQERDFMRKVIHKTLLSDIDTCVCVIPFVIELLVQNKNKTPMQQTRPLLAIPAKKADGTDLTPEERQAAERRVEGQKRRLEEEVPLVVMCLLERHEKVVELMRKAHAPAEVGQSRPPLGFFRFGLVKLVQAVLVTNYPYGNYLIARTNLITACLNLFFEYYTHSILHAVIAYIVRYIMAMGNMDLVELVIKRLRLPHRIVEVFEHGDSNDMLDNLRGYLKMLAIAIRNNPFAEELLSGEPKWASFVSDTLLREEPKSSTNTAEVALARKRMAGQPRTLTDHVEDKIA